jgi:hypothetical protein
MAGPKHKRQSLGDQHIALARAFFETRSSSETPIAELRAAAKKIGEKKEQRLAWAIAFAQEPGDRMTRADFYNRNLEVAVFLRPGLALAEENESAPYNAGLFFDPRQLPQLKERFLKVIKAAAVGTGLSFNVAHISVNVDATGVSYGINYQLLDQKKYGAARFEHAELTLAQLIAEHWGYVGFCNPKKHGCGRYFLKSRTDREFCSKTCLNRSTTYRQRRKEPLA